jgi:hypothetical protein
MVTVVRVGILAITVVASSAFPQPNLSEISWNKQTFSDNQAGEQSASRQSINALKRAVATIT